MPNIPQINIGGTVYKIKDAELSNEVSNLIIFNDTVDYLINDIEVIDIETISASHHGYYLNTSGNPAVTAGEFTYTDPIPVYAGNKYIFIGRGTPLISAVVFCDSSGNNRTSVYVYANDSDDQIFTYSPSLDGYIMLSFCYSTGIQRKLVYGKPINNKIEKVETDIEETNDVIDSITESKDNIVDMSQLQIGKNWQNADASNRAIVNIEAKPNTEYFIRVPADTSGAIINVSVVEKTNPLSAASLTSRNVNNNSSTTFKATASTGIITVQFNGRRDFVADDFSGYVLFASEGKSGISTIDSIARDTIETISERNENLVNMSQLQIGKNWQNADASNRAIVNIEAKPNTEYFIRVPADTSGGIINVSAVEKTSPLSTASIVSHDVDNDSSIVVTTSSATKTLTVQFNGRRDFVSSDFTNYVLFVTKGSVELTAIDHFARSLLGWKGKKLVWLGTSIPAAGKYDIDNLNSYPIMVGKQLGCTVYNEAVGSSALHCKRPDLISAANPYGFMNNFEAVSRCITNSLEEMNWIIQHYNDSSVFTQNVPASLSNDDKDFIRSCSWEIKLQKYFTASNFPDAWIIDHGHNDIPSEYSEGTYYEQEAISGTRHDGYFHSGEFTASNSSSYLEFDVTNELYVWISGTFGEWYDIFDIYDSNGNNIGYRINGVEQTINGLKVNVANATKLRVSNNNTSISTVEVKKLVYPMYESLYSYQGGLDFIVYKILSYNPKARIIMIGEYENQKYPTVSENQIIAAERWEFPIYRQWEELGFSQQLIEINGEYKTMLNIIIPDNLHPHTDTSGFALETMANNIAAWLQTIR